MIKETFKTVTRKVVDTRTVTCDFCNEEIKRSTYEVKEARISCEEGSSYLEGRFVTKSDVDICLGCFESKLIPWIQSQGVSMRETESDY